MLLEGDADRRGRDWAPRVLLHGATLPLSSRESNRGSLSAVVTRGGFGPETSSGRRSPVPHRARVGTRAQDRRATVELLLDAAFCEYAVDP
jgi:hypothetical protein